MHWAKAKDIVVELIEHGCALDARNFNRKTALQVRENDLFTLLKI